VTKRANPGVAKEVVRFAAYSALFGLVGVVFSTLSRLIMSGPRAADPQFWVEDWQHPLVLVAAGAGAELIRRALVRAGTALGHWRRRHTAGGRSALQ
jgi:hypothetical protein